MPSAASRARMPAIYGTGRRHSLEIQADRTERQPAVEALKSAEFNYGTFEEKSSRLTVGFLRGNGRIFLSDLLLVKFI